MSASGPALAAARRSEWVAFAACQAGVVALALSLELSEPIQQRLAPLCAAAAGGVAALIEGLGLAVLHTGPYLDHPSGFGYEIHVQCLALALSAFLVATILAAPRPAHRRGPALVAGLAALWSLNLARLVALYAIGVDGGETFTLAHAVGEVLLLVFTGTFAAAWWGWPSQRR